MTKNSGTTKYFSAKRLAMLSVLTAMALIMFMVESLFPPLFLPGAKMGLSNIFTLLAVLLLGPVDAVVLVLVRTTLGSVFTGNVSTLMYSMSAGLVSVLVTSILVEFAYPHVSIVAMSVVSAVLHNITQNLVFCLVSNTPQMVSYIPWLALLGVLAGVIVGFAVWFILRAIPVRTFASVLGVSAQEFEAVQRDAAGESNAAHEQDASDVSEPTADVEEPAADVEEPAADAAEPAADIEEPVADVEEPAADIEEPAADAAESANAPKQE